MRLLTVGCTTPRITTSVATRVEKEIAGVIAVGELSDYDKPIITTSVGTRVGEGSIDPIPASEASGSLDFHKAPQHNTQRKYADVKKIRRLSRKVKRLETKIEKNCTACQKKLKVTPPRKRVQWGCHGKKDFS